MARCSECGYKGTPPKIKNCNYCGKSITHISEKTGKERFEEVIIYVAGCIKDNGHIFTGSSVYIDCGFIHYTIESEQDVFNESNSIALYELYNCHISCVGRKYIMVSGRNHNDRLC